MNPGGLRGNGAAVQRNDGDGVGALLESREFRTIMGAEP
jgi:hypothetical protein